jgi:uncharacterized BrkB/YihY/UPF0761 family membrane protein
MTRLKRLAEWARSTVPFRVITAFGESQASNYAAALAFSAFLAMFPMMLGALSIIGLAIRDPATEARFQGLILQLFPGNAQPELQHAIQGVKQSAGWLALVSLGGLVWSASGIFATMEFALTQIFGTKQRDMLRQKLMGFVMMLVLVVALAITVAANSAAGYLSPYIPYAWVLSFFIGAAVMVAPRGTARGRADRSPVARVSPVHALRRRFQLIRGPVRAVFPSRHVAVPAQRAAAARCGL